MGETMQSIPLWPRPNELSFSKEPIQPDEYFRSVLLWASEKGAEEYTFLSLEEWPGKNESLSDLEIFSLRPDSSLSKDREISLLVPPLLFQKTLVFWEVAPKSLSHSFFHIAEKISQFRKQASEFFGCDFSAEPNFVWREKLSLPYSVLTQDKLWEKKHRGERISLPLSLSQVFFLGSLFGIENISSLEWVREEGTELESVVSDFIRVRMKSKFGNLLSALGKISEEEIGKYEPYPFFSFSLQILIQACILAEAWDELVSRWIEERPRREEAPTKIREWTAKETHAHAEEGFEILFEERSILLLDKYADRSDRFLLQRLEKEYSDARKLFELESYNKKKELDEIRIPEALSKVSAHSSLSWPEDLQSVWSEIGESYKANLENLLQERKKIASLVPEQGGKTAESWNILLTFRSE